MMKIRKTHSSFQRAGLYVFENFIERLDRAVHSRTYIRVLSVKGLHNPLIAGKFFHINSTLPRPLNIVQKFPRTIDVSVSVINRNQLIVRDIKVKCSLIVLRTVL
jgi:hypothetical protein